MLTSHFRFLKSMIRFDFRSTVHKASAKMNDSEKKQKTESGNTEIWLWKVRVSLFDSHKINISESFCINQWSRNIPQQKAESKGWKQKSGNKKIEVNLEESQYLDFCFSLFHRKELLGSHDLMVQIRPNSSFEMIWVIQYLFCSFIVNHWGNCEIFLSKLKLNKISCVTERWSSSFFYLVIDTYH